MTVVTLSCGCHLQVSAPAGAVQQLCGLHGDVVDVVWIEKVGTDGRR